MGRRAAPLVPRKAVVNGVVQWAVRVPASLRKQEGVSKDGRKYLGTEAIAKGYCKKLEGLLRNYSDKAHGLTDAQKIEAQECFTWLSESPGASLTAAVEMYLTHRAQAQRSVTLEDLGEKYQTHKAKAGGKGSKPRTLAEHRLEWSRFVKAFPGRLASSITAEEVHDWLFGLTKLDGTAPALQSLRNTRRIVHAEFEFARERVRRWVSENPVAEVRLPEAHRERVVLLPSPQVERILSAAHPRLVPYLAICAFAGARPDQAKKMTWEQIHFDRGVDGAGELEVPADTDKTDRERIVPMRPNLRAWLLLTPESRRQGKVYYSKDFFWAARDSIGLKAWPQDCLRHNYGTYRLKITGSFGTVAEEMGNSEAVIRDRYRRSVSETEAVLYWQILPTAAAGANAVAYWQIFQESATALKAEWKWRTHPRAS